MTTSKARRAADSSSSAAPPFRPDPEIIGNIEGNDRIRRGDQEAARRYLDDHDLQAPSDDPGPTAT